MRISRRGILAASLIGSSIWRLKAAPSTNTITDALGRKVEVKSPVARVVINFNFEEFTAVAGTEGWKQVVGISRTPWAGWRPAIFSRYSAVIPNLAEMPDIGHTD